MANLLIIGASKGIGLTTVRQALKAGHDVRAFARSADRIPLSDAKLEKYRGDALDRDDVANALEGIDVVIQTLGVPAGPAMVLRPVTLFSAATRVLVDSMEAAAVRRLITVTGFGAGDSRASIDCLQRIPFRLLLGRAYDDKDRQEQIIRDSGLNWTIVRPGVLTNGVHSGRYKVLLMPNEWHNGIVSRAHVADFIVKAVADDAYIGKTPVIVA